MTFALGRAAIAAMIMILASIEGVGAAQDDTRLPGLFERLKSPLVASEAGAVQGQIWSIWIETEHDDVRLLMHEGIRRMERDEMVSALAAFNAIVVRAPEFAEGWNKRATVHFLLGDFSSSVSDIETTLALEPRHFGALAGLGQIYLALDKKPAALRAFEAALAINPHMAGVRRMVDELKRDLAGKPT